MLATQSIQVRLVTMVCLWDGRIYQEPRAFRLNHDLRDIARGNGNPPYLLGCEVDQVRKRVLQVAPDLSRLFGEHVTLRCKHDLASGTLRQRNCIAARKIADLISS